jgi:hypothetical protein
MEKISKSLVLPDVSYGGNDKLGMLKKKRQGKRFNTRRMKQFETLHKEWCRSLVQVGQ